MIFDEFTYRIEKSHKLKTKGIASQMVMAPKLRHRFTEEVIKKNNPKAAAVVCLFFPDIKNNVRFLLMLRSHYDGTHASQIGFPGGKIDDGDGSLEVTAKRELFEEVGIAENEVQLFREMSQTYIPPSNFLVTPFLGLIDFQPQFIPNHEVAELFQVPLQTFMDDNCIATMKADTSYAGIIDTPCFRLEGAEVWGATAMMLNEIREFLKEI